jgi:hypothetical protein
MSGIMLNFKIQLLLFKMKRTIETIQVTTDAEGNTKQVKKTHVEIVPNEPDFVKMFFRDEDRLRLSSGEHKVMMFMLSKMGYDNKVNLPLGLKKVMCLELGFYKEGAVGIGGVVLKEDEEGNPEISVSSLNTVLWNLCKKNAMAKEHQGVYIVNPYYFAKGKWQAIKAIYDNYERIQRINEQQRQKKTELQKIRDENLEKGRNRIR